jgi:hypothetical protein
MAGRSLCNAAKPLIAATDRVISVAVPLVVANGAEQ